MSENRLSYKLVAPEILKWTAHWDDGEMSAEDGETDDFEDDFEDDFDSDDDDE